MQNLIHPSLFPFVIGITPLRSAPPELVNEILAIHRRLKPETIQKALNAYGAACDPHSAQLLQSLLDRKDFKSNAARKPPPRYGGVMAPEEDDETRELDYGMRFDVSEK